MVLGHGSLITADVGAAAFGVAALYRFRIWLLTSSLLNALVLGVVTGFALLTKFVFVPTFPIIALLLLPVWRGRDLLKFRCIGRDFVHVGVAVIVSFLVINIVYDFEGSFTQLGDIKFSNKLLRANVDVGNRPEWSQPEDRLTYVQNRFSGTLLGRVPIPLPKLYLQGIDLVGIEAAPEGSGARSYLMGQWKDGGWWYYYIIGVLTKEPLAILILGSMAMGAYVCRAFNFFRINSANVPIRELAMIAIPAVVIFCFVSMQTGFNRHLRYTLPAYPFGYILVSSVVQFLDNKKLAVFASMLVASSMFAFPHWLSYYNEAAGGPKNGSFWLLGSNTDWSQDLLRLKRWMDEHPNAGPMKSKIYCSRYSPSALEIHTDSAPPFVPGSPEIRDKDGKRGPQPGWYTVSLRVLKETIKGNDSGYQYFERFKPVDQAGYTILIYHISPAEAAEVTKSLEFEERQSTYLWSSRE